MHGESEIILSRKEPSLVQPSQTRMHPKLCMSWAPLARPDSLRIAQSNPARIPDPKLVIYNKMIHVLSH